MGKKIQAGCRVMEAGGAGVELSDLKGRVRKARADPPLQEGAAAWRDQTVKRMNWGFGLRRAVGGGHFGREEEGEGRGLSFG